MTKQRTPEEYRERLERVKTLKLFNFIKGLQKNAKHLDPDERNVDEDVLYALLNESMFTEDREEILIVLKILRSLLQNSNSMPDFAEKGQKKMESAQEVLDENMQKITSFTEKYYTPLGELDLYYRNTGLDQIDNLTLITLDEKLWNDDPDDEIFQEIYKEVYPRFDDVDKSKSIGYMVMPKFPGKALLDRLADLAYNTKSTLLVGYRDLANVETTLNFLERDGVGGADAKWGNVVVFANTAVTKDGIRLSPVPAIAGKMHITLLAQPVAGLESGTLAIDGLRYNVTQSELTLFKKHGVVPLLNAFNADMGYGTWTAFKGENIEVQQYAVVRVLNWLSRSMCHNLNKCTHTIALPEKLGRINQQVADFLKQAEENRIIRKGNVAQFNQDKDMPDKIDIKLDIHPLWAIRLFAMKIEAQKGVNADSELSQS